MAYRNKYGFKSINDLTKVKGIGEKTFEQLSSQIEL
jgi:competence ComEA-like helix-hairpin-helix protein